MNSVLITGGAGFIGSHLVDLCLLHDDEVIVIDKLTYAGSMDNLEKAARSDHFHFVQADINDSQLVNKLLEEYKVKTVYHLAAESHVDNSISDASPFIHTNINGTYSLLVAALKYWNNHDDFPNFRFIHVSTDEVFGHLKEGDAPFEETTRYSPNSPYSASKAASDHLSHAWHATYGLPVIITNCSNNFGPRQNAEKLIPVIIKNALNGSPIPIYGEGKNIRDWLYVEDHCKGLILAAQKGKPGESYCFGGNNEKRNIDLALEICGILDVHHPRKDGNSYQKQITFVEDRKGHDWRYAINNNKVRLELGYNIEGDVQEKLEKTVLYYKDYIIFQTERSRPIISSSS